MELLAGEGFAYGYRKLTIALRKRHHLVINKKKVYRLCKEMNVLRPQRLRVFRHPRKVACNRAVTGPNQLWEMDVKYGWIVGEQRFFFLMDILDVFDRSVVAYHIGLTCEARHAVQIVQEGLMKRQLFAAKERPVIRTDNGPQFISHLFEEACERFQLTHERISPKTPNQNAHIEAFHGILERECYQWNEFDNYRQTYEVVTEFIRYYNERRIHGSLYDMAPYEYREAVKQGVVQAKVVKA